MKCATAPATQVAEPKVFRPTGLYVIDFATDGKTLSLDAESVRGDRQHRQGWVINDATKDKTVTTWRTRKALELIDCDTTAVRELSNIYYDAKGAPVFPAESHDPKDVKPTYYPNGTIGFAPVQAMCNKAFDTPLASQ
jgi:hypothetical protein